MFSSQNLLLLAAVVFASQFALAQEDSDELNAVKKLEMLGVKTERAEYSPGRPVVRATFTAEGRFNEKYLHLLKSCPKLTALEFKGPVIADEGMKVIVQLKGLESLSLIDTKVTDTGLNELGGLDHLTTLIIYGDKITDVGLAEIARAEFLRELVMTSPKISDAGLKEICRLKFLTTLSLANARITDAGSDDIAQMKCLSHLNLAGARFTDAGIRKISLVESLTWLDIAHAKISDQGLLQLANLQKLRTLGIRQPKITDEFTGEGLAELRRRLPELQTTFAWEVAQVAGAPQAGFQINVNVNANDLNRGPLIRFNSLTQSVFTSGGTVNYVNGP